MFESKDQILSDFPTLVGFTSFRECMPFFDNDKFKLKGDEKESLLKLLNSNKSKSYVLKEIRKLQASKIGIKNTRNQRLADLENEEKVFIDFYNYIYHLGNEDSSQICIQLEEAGLSDNLIKTIAKNTSAQSSDGLKCFDFKEDEIKKVASKLNGNRIWIDYIEILKDFIAQTNPKKIRRFRRLIPPIRIVNLADMLNQLLQKKNSS
jgi:hypothetical protein